MGGIAVMLSRSEASRLPARQILRFAQGDTGGANGWQYSHDVDSAKHFDGQGDRPFAAVQGDTEAFVETAKSL